MNPTRTYLYPTEINKRRVRKRAARRRAALTDAGCSTYETGLRGGQIAIICLCCGLGSNNQNDVEQKYCGFCHEFHSEEAE